MTTYEHKGLGDGLGPARSGPFAGGAAGLAAQGVEFGAPCLIGALDGKQLRHLGVETKTSSDDYGALLDEARARLAGGGGDDDDEEEEIMTPETVVPEAGPDEVVVLEAPVESLTEDTRKRVLAAQLVAEARLPAPGLPRGLRVRFCAPYSRSMAEAYEGISGRPVRALVVGKSWSGHYNPNNGETWVDIGRHSGELIRSTLHELTHAWRERTTEASRMSAEQKEEEAWAWAEELLPEVLTLLNTPQEEW